MNEEKEFLQDIEKKLEKKEREESISKSKDEFTKNYCVGCKHCLARMLPDGVTVYEWYCKVKHMRVRPRQPACSHFEPKKALRLIYENWGLI